MESLKDKRVLIVGATGGIGSETARLMKPSQCQLWLAGRNPEKLALLAEELRVEPNRRAELDVTREDAISDLARRVRAEWGGLDALVIASGLGILAPLEELSVDDFRLSLEVNLVGPYLLCKHFVPMMKAQGKGLVINLTGVLAKTPMASATAYCASKYGLNGFLKALREELKRTEVRITNLYLGGTDSPFWDSIDMRVPRDKMVTAREAAKAVWFLCQQPSSGVVSEMVLQPFYHQAL